MAESSSVLVDEQRDPTSVGMHVSLHPLPIINMSEHITRAAVQSSSTSDVRVLGALLGSQEGRTIEIHTTFELVLLPDGVSVDLPFLHSRLAQFKQVFQSFDFVGWYSNGFTPTHDDMAIHRQLLECNDSPLFLQLSPTQSRMDKAQAAGELPIGIYETFVEVAAQPSSTPAEQATASAEGPKMLFRPAHYGVETGEAERIAVDHASKPPATADDENRQSSLIATLTTQKNAVQMLMDRIQLLVKYVDDIQAERIPRDHESLRQISSLVAGLPASGDLKEFQDEFLTEYNDLLLTTYLSEVTDGLSVLNEFIDKFDFTKTNTDDSLGGGSMQAMTSLQGGRSGWRSRGGRAAGKTRAVQHT